jgi:hypothetical protein
MSLELHLRQLIREELTAFHGATQAKPADAKPAKAATKKAETTAPTAGAAAPASTAATPAPAPAPTPEKGVQAQIINIKMASDAMLELASKKGRQAAIDLMAKFGVGKAGELKPAQYEAFYNEAKAGLTDAPANADLLS